MISLGATLRKQAAQEGGRVPRPGEKRKNRRKPEHARIKEGPWVAARKVLPYAGAEPVSFEAQASGQQPKEARLTYLLPSVAPQDSEAVYPERGGGR